MQKCRLISQFKLAFGFQNRNRNRKSSSRRQVRSGSLINQQACTTGVQAMAHRVVWFKSRRPQHCHFRNVRSEKICMRMQHNSEMWNTLVCTHALNCFMPGLKISISMQRTAIAHEAAAFYVNTRQIECKLTPLTAQAAGHSDSDSETETETETASGCK